MKLKVNKGLRCSTHLLCFLLLALSNQDVSATLTITFDEIGMDPITTSWDTWSEFNLPNAGILNVSTRGRNGTVCYDGFSDEAAQVACREMGLSGGTLRDPADLDMGLYSLSQQSHHMYKDAVAARTPLISSFSCNGDEDRLDLCSYDVFTTHAIETNQTCSQLAEVACDYTCDAKVMLQHTDQYEFSSEASPLCADGMIQDGSSCQVSCKLPYAGELELSCDRFENPQWPHVQSEPHTCILTGAQHMTQEYCYSRVDMCKVKADNCTPPACCTTDTNFCVKFLLGVIDNCSLFAADSKDRTECDEAGKFVDNMELVTNVTAGLFYVEVTAAGLLFLQGCLYAMSCFLIWNKPEEDTESGEDDEDMLVEKSLKEDAEDDDTPPDSVQLIMKVYATVAWVGALILLIELVMTILDVATVKFTNVFTQIGELIDRGHCFTRPGDQLLVEFFADMETKFVLGVGEMILTLANIMLQCQDTISQTRLCCGCDDWKDAVKFSSWEVIQTFLGQVLLQGLDLWLSYQEYYVLTLPPFQDFEKLIRGLQSKDAIQLDTSGKKAHACVVYNPSRRLAVDGQRLMVDDAHPTSSWNSYMLQDFQMLSFLLILSLWSAFIILWLRFHKARPASGTVLLLRA